MRIKTDASVAHALALRRGLGGVRHIEVNQLWLQEKVRTKAVEVRKIRGDINPADLFTKHIPSRANIHSLVNLFGCEYREGRSAAAPLLRPMTEGNNIANVDDGSVEDVLPHLRPMKEIDELYPRMEPMEEGHLDQEYDMELEKICKSFEYVGHEPGGMT